MRHPVASTESRESSALLIGAGVFVVTFIVAWLSFLGREIPISGRGSVGQFVALGSALAAIIMFVIARVLLNTNSTDGAALQGGQDFPTIRLRWYDIGALALAHAVVALLGWLAVADLMAKSFTGAMVFTVPGAILAAVAIAVSSYVVVLSSINLTPMSVSVILVVFLVAGSFTSMLSATDPLWWQKNLSTLGISDDISALAFNLTLIVAGVIVTTIAHYATAAIPVRTAKEVSGRNFVRGSLVLLGVLLACVGIFPVDRFLTARNVAASGMAAVYIAMVLCLQRFIPAMPRVFVLLGYVFVAVIVVLAVFFVTGYYNLTAVELVAFLLIFSWLVVFLRNSRAMGRGDGPNADKAAASMTGSNPVAS
nr:hypothetical protein [Arthrobacter sp. BF1]